MISGLVPLMMWPMGHRDLSLKGVCHTSDLISIHGANSVHNPSTFFGQPTQIDARSVRQLPLEAGAPPLVAEPAVPCAARLMPAAAPTQTAAGCEQKT